MEGRRITRHLTGIAPLAALSVVLALALAMMAAATQNSALFGRVYTLLLIVNVAGIALLLLLLLLNLHALIVQRRARVLGSRLTLRLVGALSLIAIVPVFVVYLFSLQLLNKGIDSWFDVRIEQALHDALSLGRSTLDRLLEDLVRKTQAMALEIDGVRGREATVLNDLREHYDVFDATLIGADGRIVASTSHRGLGDRAVLVPDRPREAILAHVRQGEVYANVDTTRSGLQLRVVVPVGEREMGAGRVLQTLQPVGPRYSSLTDSVQSAFAEYEKLVYLRKSLKLGFTLTLTLVALFTLLLALWAALFFARRLVAPLRDLAEGTQAVAQGNYRKQIPVTSRDELGLLVQSFNDMTRKIHRAQMQIRRSQREAETQRTQLETVLTHLSSGVLSFDESLTLHMHNAAAAQILGVDLDTLVGRPLAALSQHEPALAPLVEAVAEHAGRDGEWQREVTLARAARRSIIVRGTRLPGLDDKPAGLVLVFDDVTALIQAQRDAAWGEVARRLAHEIKNPLTPIQLSAERIRQKCLEVLNERPRETLDRATRTIIQQVEAMKTMVNEFSDYARPLAVQPEPFDLNLLVRDVVDLYEGKHRWVAIELALDPTIPMIQSDPRRLRQVMHNLILNADDALAGVDDPRLTVQTRCMKEADCRFIELSVRDNGGGFAPTVIDRVFEPYVTTKEKGTGLGLAIVKKIVEEHGGAVWVENLKPRGAAITVRLPLRANAAPVAVRESA